MGIALDHGTFDTTVGRVRAGADRLAGDAARVERRVDDLLARWHGVAADGYADAWSDWRAGARDVLSGLHAIAELLDRTHADLTDRDRGSESALALLTARLGGTPP